MKEKENKSAINCYKMLFCFHNKNLCLRKETFYRFMFENKTLEPPSLWVTNLFESVFPHLINNDQCTFPVGILHHLQYRYFKLQIVISLLSDRTKSFVHWLFSLLNISRYVHFWIRVNLFSKLFYKYNWNHIWNCIHLPFTPTCSWMIYILTRTTLMRRWIQPLCLTRVLKIDRFSLHGTCRTVKVMATRPYYIRANSPPLRHSLLERHRCIHRLNKPRLHQGPNTFVTHCPTTWWQLG